LQIEHTRYLTMDFDGLQDPYSKASICTANRTAKFFREHYSWLDSWLAAFGLFASGDAAFSKVKKTARHIITELNR